MVGLSRVKDHQKLWFQSKNKRLKPMVHNGHTLKSCSHRRQTMTTTTSKSLTREIDLDGSSHTMASTKQDGDRKTLTDIVYIVTICHACMPVCRQCPIYTLYFKRTYLYDIKYLSVRPHKNKIVTTALRKHCEKSTRKERTNLNQSL
jgi:hypothetical protein